MSLRWPQTTIRWTQEAVRFGDPEVESVSVAAGLVEEASESSGGQFGHQSHLQSHGMDGIVRDKLEAEGVNVKGMCGTMGDQSLAPEAGFEPAT